MAEVTWKDRSQWLALTQWHAQIITESNRSEQSKVSPHYVEVSSLYCCLLSIILPLSV